MRDTLRWPPQEWRHRETDKKIDRMMEIVLMIVNVACLVGVICFGVKAWRMRREAEEMLEMAEEAYDKAHILAGFIKAYKECRTEDQMADCLIVWVPILEAHGIAVESEEED